jgi:hypothetical protein
MIKESRQETMHALKRYISIIRATDYIYIYIYIYIYTHTYIHTYIHAYTHTHI